MSTPAGYIFMCNNETQSVCLENQIFATTSKSAVDYEHVDFGKVCFLMNINSKRMYGAWNAMGQMSNSPIRRNIFDDSKFPVQVEVQSIFPDRACPYVMIDEVKSLLQMPYKISTRLNPVQVQMMLDMFRNQFYADFRKARNLDGHRTLHYGHQERRSSHHRDEALDRSHRSNNENHHHISRIQKTPDCDENVRRRSRNDFERQFKGGNNSSRATPPIQTGRGRSQDIATPEQKFKKRQIQSQVVDLNHLPPPPPPPQPQKRYTEESQEACENKRQKQESSSRSLEKQEAEEEQNQKSNLNVSDNAKNHFTKHFIQDTKFITPPISKIRSEVQVGNNNNNNNTNNINNNIIKNEVNTSQISSESSGSKKRERGEQSDQIVDSQTETKRLKNTDAEEQQQKLEQQQKIDQTDDLENQSLDEKCDEADDQQQIEEADDRMNSYDFEGKLVEDSGQKGEQICDEQKNKSLLASDTSNESPSAEKVVNQEKQIEVEDVQAPAMKFENCEIQPNQSEDQNQEKSRQNSEILEKQEIGDIIQCDTQQNWGDGNLQRYEVEQEQIQKLSNEMDSNGFEIQSETGNQCEDTLIDENQKNAQNVDQQSDICKQNQEQEQVDQKGEVLTNGEDRKHEMKQEAEKKVISRLRRVPNNGPKFKINLKLPTSFQNQGNPEEKLINGKGDKEDQ